MQSYLIAAAVLYMIARGTDPVAPMKVSSEKSANHEPLPPPVSAITPTSSNRMSTSTPSCRIASTMDSISFLTVLNQGFK